jgi:hypothetical protein
MNDKNNAFLNGSNLFGFLSKKTERLSSAVYLVTNFVPENEPLRLRLRECSLELLTKLLSLKSAPASAVPLSDNLLSLISEIVALLEVGHSSGYFSPMNHEVLSREYRSIGSIISERRHEIDTKKVSLPKEFFEVPLPLPEATKTQRQSSPLSLSSLQGSVYQGQNRAAKSDYPRPETQGQTTIRHSGRRETIITLLKKRPFVTVKDVSEVIGNCSEKTIQRELLLLVGQGVLKKEGERRWSKYSFA